MKEEDCYRKLSVDSDILKNKQSLHCGLTNQSQDEQELSSVLIEAEVGRLRVHDGTDQAAFGCEEA